MLARILGSIVATATTRRLMMRPGSTMRGIWHAAAGLMLAVYLLDVTLLRRDLL